ncbi:dihydrofolate reductase family protein [Nocardioides bruguierae]|uniref:dihydrofolate reductase family protein n=1 Tax=Nocardioides bruguierae TaxID=2945102 RepID=UPI0020207F82|nr:dihydrofolate reductase family protein [Nocardioides bruguierae]MCL8026355.1 dihydrofolate reductase family protein [Nocardioides bruguierae]
MTTLSPQRRAWRARAFVGASLDGYLARPDGDLDWLTALPEDVGHAATRGEHPGLEWETFFPEIDTLLMGRETYETVAGFEEWPFTGLRVLVLSASDAAPTEDGRVRVVAGLVQACDLLDEVGAREVYVDGGRTVQSFLAAGVLDEITVSTAPVLLGAGRRLFGGLGADVQLRVLGSHVTADGLVRTTWEVRRG